jgi:predicted metal-binding membrane protein
MFLGIAALFFAASAAATVTWCDAMSTMGGMAMPGGWTMSMTWMRMPGQTWPGAAAAFLAMWMVMMAAMMAPSLVPRLLRYHEALGASGRGAACWLTALAAAAYFLLWTAAGLAVFVVGVAGASLTMAATSLSEAVPAATAAALVAAGVVQCTAWKAGRLARCREESAHPHGSPASASAAWRYGWQLGVDCCTACAPLTAMFLVLGVMDLAVMTLVTVAITLERLAPAGARVARTVGAVAIGAGTLLLGRALTG